MRVAPADLPSEPVTVPRDATDSTQSPAADRRGIRHPDGSTTVELQYPIGSGDDRIERVRMRPVTIGALRAMDETPGALAKEVVFVARLASMSVAVIEELRIEDFRELQHWANVMLKESKRTGESRPTGAR